MILRRAVPGQRIGVAAAFWEALILGVIAAVAIGDGLWTAYKAQMSIGAREAGGYLVLLGTVLAGLTAVYLFQPHAPANGSGATTDLRKPAVVLAMFAAYACLIAPLGYLGSTALFFAVYLRVFGQYGWVTSLASALTVGVATALLWERLGMALPTGLIPWP